MDMTPPIEPRASELVQVFDGRVTNFADLDEPPATCLVSSLFFNEIQVLKNPHQFSDTFITGRCVPLLLRKVVFSGIEAFQMQVSLEAVVLPLVQ